MKTTKNGRLACGLIALLGLAGAGLTGCYPYYCEEDWDCVEHDHGYVYPATILTVEVIWSAPACNGDCPAAVNLDLELLTPAGHLIPYDYLAADGCEHFGDDPGTHGYGDELIYCQEPLLGHYEMRIINQSDVPQRATLTSAVSSEDPYSGVPDQISQEIDLAPWELVTVPLVLQP
jgi:hypothetical protein